MRIITYIILALTFFVSRAQKSAGSCDQCNMVIKDPLFAAMAVDQNGKSFNFDAIECLVNYLKEVDEENFDELLIADYFNSGKLVNAKTATFLKSREIASPMGAYVSGFASKSDAEKVQKAKRR